MTFPSGNHKYQQLHLCTCKAISKHLKAMRCDRAGGWRSVNANYCTYIASMSFLIISFKPMLVKFPFIAISKIRLRHVSIQQNKNRVYSLRERSLWDLLDD